VGHSETLELRELAIPCCLTGRDLFVVLIFRAGTVPAPVLLDSRDAGTDRKLNLSVHNLALGADPQPCGNEDSIPYRYSTSYQHFSGDDSNGVPLLRSLCEWLYVWLAG